MKYLKEYEKINRPIFIGDTVIWNGHNRSDFNDSLYTLPDSHEINNGEPCEITKLKTIKGELYAKAKNIKTQKPISKILNSNNNRMTWSNDGHWWKFDYYFKHELDHTVNKYNL